MVRVVLVTETWSKTVEIPSADELIDAEGMSWERDGDTSEIADGAGLQGSGHADLVRYVPAVSG